MKNLFLIIVASFILASCSTKSQLVYLNDSYSPLSTILDYSTSMNYIEIGDILKIDVQTIVPEAVIPYNKTNYKQSPTQSLDLIKLEGYLVNNLSIINFPVLGEISVSNISINQLEMKITSLLLDGGHLTNPTVRVRRINSKFTILGEVKNPGTFSYIDEKLNIFQALGYAGDLTIFGNRKEITLIREKAGLQTVYKIALTKSDLLKKPYYHIQNNDVIIIEPNYNKVKSAGFIGSPQSIASLSSLLLSITLLLINK